MISNAQTSTALALKERPLLMKGPMVLATLDNRKTQTRRVIKPQPKYGIVGQGHEVLAKNPASAHPDVSAGKWIRCPYGQPGDLLWVRETWNDSHDGYVYRADCPKSDTAHIWRPSIFMPKAAARLWLRVTDVRVERVQDISGEDAEAEGCLPDTFYRELDERERIARIARILDTGPATPEQDWFKGLWDSINAKRGYGWDTNPWVWVITFERCNTPAAAIGGAT